jgi:hypothetical protein
MLKKASELKSHQLKEKRRVWDAAPDWFKNTMVRSLTLTPRPNHNRPSDSEASWVEVDWERLATGWEAKEMVEAMVGRVAVRAHPRVKGGRRLAAWERCTCAQRRAGGLDTLWRRQCGSVQGQLGLHGASEHPSRRLGFWCFGFAIHRLSWELGGWKTASIGVRAEGSTYRRSKRYISILPVSS